MKIPYSVWKIIWGIRDIPANFYLNQMRKEPQVYRPPIFEELPFVGMDGSQIPPVNLMDKYFFLENPEEEPPEPGKAQEYKEPPDLTVGMWD